MKPLSYGKRHTSDATNRNGQDSAREKYMPTDRVRKTKKIFVNFKLCLYYAENTPDYVEISTVDKIDNDTFPVYRTTVERKTLQSLARSLSS